MQAADGLGPARVVGEDDGFGALLRAHRLAAEMSREELAQASGLSVRAIGALEGGRTRRLQRRSARGLGRALGLRGEALAGFLAAARAPSRQSSDSGFDSVAQFDIRAARLPADLEDFAGRAAEIEYACDLLGGLADHDHQATADHDHQGSVHDRGADQNHATPILTISGPGGIGKSALAIRVAHRVAGRFPGGTLYVNLRGSYADPLQGGEALSGLLRGLGVDGSTIPDDEQQRGTLYRSILERRRVLVILDDARDAAQIEPLLPSAYNCAAIITSRSGFEVSAKAETLALGALDRHDAADLFAGIVGPGRVEAEQTAAAHLLDHCAGLPLALRIAGACLATQPDSSIASVAEHVSGSARRLYESEPDTDRSPTRACFEAAYAVLARSDAIGELQPAHAWRLLALWDGRDIALDAAAALLDAAELDTEDVLDHLVGAHLLESPAPGRYRFHDQLKPFAAERAHAEEPSEQRREAVDRVLEWYLHSAIDAHCTISPGRRLPGAASPFERWSLEFDTVDEAEAWCASERANLVAATKMAVDNGRDDIAWRLPIAARCVFELHLYWNEWAEAHRAALTAAERSGDDHARMWVHYGLAVGYRLQRRFDEALEHTRLAREKASDLGDSAGEAAALTNVANTFTQLGKPEKALEPLEQAFAAYHAIGEATAETYTLTNLGLAYRELGRHEDAVAMFICALPGHQRSGDRLRELACLSELGNSLKNLGRLDEAFDYQATALAMAAEAGYRRDEAFSMACLGEVLVGLGRLEEAADHLERARVNSIGLGDRYLEAYILRSYAEVELANGHAGRAAGQCRKALAIFTELGDRHEVALSLAVLGTALGAVGRDDEAASIRRDALTILEELDEPRSKQTRELLRSHAG